MVLNAFGILPKPDIIEYSPEYNYGFTINFNKNGEIGKGSAIFFHLKGAKVIIDYSF